MVCNARTYCVSLVRLVLLHAGRQQLPSLLPAREGWKTVVHAHRVSASPKVGPPACGKACAVGPGLGGRGALSNPFCFSHSQYSGNSLGNSACTVPVMVRVRCLLTALPWNSTGLVPFAASAPFSPSTRANFSLSISCTGKVLPGVGLYGSLGYKYISFRAVPVDETIYAS